MDNCHAVHTYLKNFGEVEQAEKAQYLMLTQILNKTDFFSFNIKKVLTIDIKYFYLFLWNGLQNYTSALQLQSLLDYSKTGKMI